MGTISRVLHYSRLERLARDKQSSLLGQFISYEENKVINMLLQVLYSQHLIFIITYEWDNKLECYITLDSKGLLGTNNLAYLANL